MFKRILTACLFSSLLFAQGGITVSTNGDGSTIFFPIDPRVRGADLVAYFDLLNSDSRFKTDRSQVALQTAKNGLIPNLQELTSMTNGTILLAKYLLPNNSVPRGNSGRDANGGSFGYAAIPVEQTVSLIYSPGTIPMTNVFTSTQAPGTLPVFTVDLTERSQDIEQVVSLLANPPIANRNLSAFPVSIQTTLNGPFYTGGTSTNALIVDGLIPQVASVSSAEAPNGSLLLITFKALRPNQFTNQEGYATVVVAPDQVLQINFNQN